MWIYDHWFIRFHETRDVPEQEIVVLLQDKSAQILGAACLTYERSIDVGIETSFGEQGDGTRSTVVISSSLIASTASVETGSSPQGNSLGQLALKRADDDSDWAEILRCLAGTPYWANLRRAYEILQRIYGRAQRPQFAMVLKLPRDELDDLWECLSREPHDPKRHKPVKNREYSLNQATSMIRRIEHPC